MLIGLLVALALICLVAGYVAGTARSQTAVLEQTADVVIPVDAAVERRAVVRDTAVQAVVAPSATIEVVPPAPSGTVRAVVTTPAPNPGERVRSGAAVGAVSDQPIFALDLSVPLFRDLSAGTAGSDVVALQHALSAAGYGPEEAGGRFDWQTVEAVRAMYVAAGYEPPADGVTVRMADVVDVPAEGAVVAQAGAAGSIVDATSPLVTLTVGAPVALGRAGALAEADFQLDELVEWAGPAGSVGTGAIVWRSAFRPADEQQPAPGVDLRIAFIDGEIPPASSTITITKPVTEEQTLAVPSTAVRQDERGSYVVVLEGGASGGDREKRVPVTVTHQADGWTALEDDGGLTTADRVRIR